MKSDRKLSRRSFLGAGAATIAGAGLGLSGTARALGGLQDTEPPEGAGSSDAPKIKKYRTLGGTGWKVSDISFGNGMMQDPALLEYAIERGINYVDTARQYYDMEIVIGKIFPAKRDKIFLTTKLVPELFTPDVTVEQLMKAIDESLERLNTDYIDCCLIHSIGEDPKKPNRTRIDNPNIYKAFEKAKSEGKIRFWGASSHGPKMIEEFGWLLDNTGIDMIMPGMNFMTKGLEPMIAKARSKNVAVVAMKTRSAAFKIIHKEYASNNALAKRVVLKWMLSQPNIDTLCISMATFEDINEFVSLSGSPQMTPEEKEILIGYGKTIDREYCRPGCDGCLGSCPQNLPIPDILRYRLYFEGYGREKYGMGLYARLPEHCNAQLCKSCPAPCEVACPFNIKIRNRLVEAHSMLTA